MLKVKRVVGVVDISNKVPPFIPVGKLNNTNPCDCRLTAGQTLDVCRFLSSVLMNSEARRNLSGNLNDVSHAVHHTHKAFKLRFVMGVSSS